MSAIRYIEPNDTGRDFVVGDMHGYRELLERLLTEIEFDSTHDRLFSVGDLIDRGPDSAGCLALVEEPWFYAVKGNHEIMMLHCSAGEQSGYGDYTLWLKNGGGWSRSLSTADRHRLLDLVKPMPLAIEIASRSVGTVGIIHAQVPCQSWGSVRHNLSNGPSRDWGEEAVWDRDLARSVARTVGSGWEPPQIDGLDRLYIGHTPAVRPLTAGNVRLIDTGIANNDRLTITEIETQRCWSIDPHGSVDTRGFADRIRIDEAP